MLLHVFTYNSLFDMSALPLLYIALSPVLVTVVLVCYFSPMWVMSAWDSCCSLPRGTGSASSTMEQEPLLQEGQSTATSDSQPHLLLQQPTKPQ
jgi:hypothetical protein